ncbi:MAG: aminotransferase class V-fold PLP-dependent enzyme [Proteobacteria bacterium]|nr:aminotransferase class V-fold PLP-dependent enzyme [Pseudomonadota bacterium]
MISTTRSLETLRQELPAATAQVYLNSGTAGPLPRVAARVSASEAARELREGRADLNSWGPFFAQRARARALSARLLGADSDEVALTHHTSEGINIVLAGHDWRAGDRILTTTLEHDAVTIPLGLLRARYGVEVAFVEIGRGEAALAALAQALAAAPARLLVLSHVAYGTGAELPLAALTRLAHDAGAAVLVDGAQTCGARPLDVHALGVDYYTLSGQKWICGPEGTGALYVRRTRLEALQPTFASYFSASRHDHRGGVELQAGAKRFETAMVYRPALAGFSASARWLLEEVGLERAWVQASALAARARSALAALPGVEIITPAAQASQLVAFDLPSFSPPRLWGLAAELARRERIVIRALPHAPFALRASCGWFNTEAEIDRLVEAIVRAVARGPEGVVVDGYGAGLPTTREP